MDFDSILSATIRVYLWPSIVAGDRDHRELELVALLNLCLGWTIVGWLVLLAWAARGPSATHAANEGSDLSQGQPDTELSQLRVNESGQSP